MPTLTYKKDDWNVINLNYLNAYEKRDYINYLCGRKDIIWMEIPQENIIKWKYRKDTKR